MVRQTKRFKKGLNKKVLSAILAASMIMTSSSFAMAAPLADDTLTDEPVVTSEAEEAEAEVDGILEDSTARTANTPTVESNDGVMATTEVPDPEKHFEIIVNKGAPLTYNGEEQRPSVEVKYYETENTGSGFSGAGVLVPEENYSVQYFNSKDANAAEGDDPYLVVTFNSGDYAGTDPVKKEFTINQADIKDVDVKWGETRSFVYNGEVQHPTVESATYSYEVNGEKKTYTLKESDYYLVDYHGKKAGTDGVMINATHGSANENLYMARLAGQGNFTGMIAEDVNDDDNVLFSIDPADFSKADVTVTVDQVEYSTGLSKSNLVKSVKVVENATGKELKFGVDYNIAIQDKNGEWKTDINDITDEGKNIGVHALRITGQNNGNYDPNTYYETSYEVVASSLATAVKDAVVKGFINNKSTYTGDNQFPDDVETALSGIRLKYGMDYVITTPKTEWVNAGEYSLELEGRNEFAGQTATVNVVIDPKSIDSNKVVAAQGTHSSGNLGSVVVTVKDTIKNNGKDKEVTLEEGKDYTFEVTKEATTTSKSGKVEVTGIGNYTTEVGSDTVVEKPYNLSDKLPLNDPSISVEVVKDFAYTGDATTIKLSDIKLVETDGSKTYTLTNGDYAIESGDKISAGFAGTHKVTLIGTGDYEGNRVVEIEVSGLSFADTFEISSIDDISLDDDAVTYKKVVNGLKVTYQSTGGRYTKYDVKLFNPEGEEIPSSAWGKEITETGTYTVQVKSQEKKYVGTLETTFNVIGHDLKKAGATIDDIADQVYTSEAITPDVTVKIGNKTLKAGEDYEVSYTDNVKGGEATAIVKGIGDYSGTIEKNFKITPADQSIEMTVAAQERDLANGSRTTGSNKCTLKLGFGMEDADLNLSYATSDKSVATVDGNGVITYQGVGECTITVTAKATDSCKEATLPITVKVGYPGTPTFTPSVTKNTAKKAFVVTSSTVRGADGFEVQYSIRSDFWRATTKDFSNTGSKLLRQTCKTVHSNRTYYVRVRAYQIVDGEKVYSKDWSPVKTVKTK